MDDLVDINIQMVAQSIEPVLEEMGFELVDMEYLSERGRWVLRIFVDKEGGITLDECAQVSREVGDLIDVKDFITHEYTLEVSSPGLDRPLKKQADFLKVIGKKVKLKMAVPVDGRRRFTGYLRKFQDGDLYLEIGNNLFTLAWKDVEKANLVYEF